LGKATLERERNRMRLCRVNLRTSRGLETAACSRRAVLARLFLASLGLANAFAAAAAEPAAPPWNAPASTAVEARELVFDNGGASLGGTLFAPRGRTGVAAVIVAHAASSPTRDLPLYRHLIELLPPLGVAVFVYDRRGSGASGGDLGASDYSTLADDAIAAQRMLEKQTTIDARRIGFWGLSQGGWIAVLAAARSPSAAFVV
jgi:cephalosporin-C deacetylase-like acetyl esterase